MLKKEIIWREILEDFFQNKKRNFQQIKLAKKLGFSLSTIFNALKVPRESRAIKVTGKNFILENPEKLLYIWATFRNLKRDIIYETFVGESVQKIEALLPPEAILGGYSAYLRIFNEAPADYDKVYVYCLEKDLPAFKKRFPYSRRSPNLIIIRADKFLDKYGRITPISQTFVDIWNFPEWYAHDFYKGFCEKLQELI